MAKINIYSDICKSIIPPCWRWVITTKHIGYLQSISWKGVAHKLKAVSNMRLYGHCGAFSWRLNPSAWERGHRDDACMQMFFSHGWRIIPAIIQVIFVVACSVCNPFLKETTITIYTPHHIHLKRTPQQRHCLRILATPTCTVALSCHLIRDRMSCKVCHTQPWTVGTPFLESTFQCINNRQQRL